MTPDTLLTIFFDAMVILIGVLIKMELHDIKARIMRVEDKFMKFVTPCAALFGLYS